MDVFRDLALGLAVSLGVGNALVWLIKSWVGQRILHDIKHTYDRKLELLKSGLKEQENISASIERRLDSGEEFVRSSAAKLTLERRKGAMAYQLECLAGLWNLMAGFRNLSSLANNLGALDVSVLDAMDVKGRRRFMEVLFPPDTQSKYDLVIGEKYRPFVPVDLYKAYCASVACAAYVMTVAVAFRTAGLDPREINRRFVKEAIDEVLPGRFVSADLQADLVLIGRLMKELEDFADLSIRGEISSGEADDVESVRKVAADARNAVSNLQLRVAADQVECKES
jgi:hypothetical protein